MKRTEARKPKPPPQSVPARTPSLVRLATPLTVTLLCAGALLGGLILLGRHARDQVADSERYTISFSAIECIPAPPNLDRAAFLNEVQYLAERPDQVRLLDEGLIPQLTEAFLKHPWVERVERINRSPRQVRIWLVYRTPVLAVAVEDQLRAVDGHGILLPANAPVAGLSVFQGTAKPPAGPAGTRWGDPAVEQAARTAR